MRHLKLMLFGTALLLVALLVLIGRAGTRAAVRSQSINMYVTFYGFNDNSPPSADIAYPKNQGESHTS